MLDASKLSDSDLLLVRNALIVYLNSFREGSDSWNDITGNIDCLREEWKLRTAAK